jgi:peptidyl-prolyl cis-trans isomerase-like 3
VCNLCAGKYTIFGHVIDGMETLDKMERAQTGPNDRPVQEIKLNHVVIHANPLAG